MKFYRTITNTLPYSNPHTTEVTTNIRPPTNAEVIQSIGSPSPQNIIRFSMITDMNVGRNPKEVLRVLDALQTDALCPCNWQPGDTTLTESLKATEEA